MTANIEARERIRAEAHRALRARQRRRLGARASGAALVVIAGAIGWWVTKAPGPVGGGAGEAAKVAQSARDEGRGGAVEILSFEPAPVERVSDDDLAEILRASGSPYGLVMTEGGGRAVRNGRGL